jgi:hypothetical protein
VAALVQDANFVNALRTQQFAAVIQSGALHQALASNAFCQALSESGGTAPMIGCHSVMESPESVRRVAPPTKIIATTNSAMTPSQRRKAHQQQKNGNG